MERDLDTLLRDAVVRTPVDTADVLARGRRRRRRTAVTRTVGALAMIGVVAGGVTIALDTSPQPPVIATEPGESLDAALPVIVAEAVDPEGLLLRAVVDPATVPDAAAATAALPGRAAQTLLAVGSDGTRVVDTELASTEVRRPDGTVVEVAGRPFAAAVLPDGSVLVVTGPDGERGAPMAAKEVHLVDGGTVATSALATPFTLAGEGDLTPTATVLQDAEQVRLATGAGAADWRAVELWRAGRGVVTDGAVVDVPVQEAAAWRLDGSTGAGVARDVLDSEARGDGLVLDVIVGGAGSAYMFGLEGTGPQVVDGRLAFARQATSDSRGLVYAAVISGPGDAIVVPLATAAVEKGGPGATLGVPGRPFLSADGALWFGDADEVRRIAPGRLVPRGGPVSHDQPLAMLPELPTLATTGGPGVAVASPGGTADAPSEPVDGVLLQELGVDCCQRVHDVAPDGSVLSYAGVTAPDGGTRELDGLDGLWSAGLDEQWSRLAAFDEDGAVWALDDRWWSTAAFPDLVVARPGETSFTSVGHVPLRDLLDVDVSDVLLDVRGDEVALVSIATDPAGNRDPGHRVVLVRDGEPLTADERAASVGRLPGVTATLDGAQVGRTALTAHAGTPADPLALHGPWAWSLGGPLLGPDGVTGAVTGLGRDLAPTLRNSWIGGGVVATAFGDSFSEPARTSDLTVLLARQDGAVAAVRLPDGASAFAWEVFVTADGSVVVVTEEATTPALPTRVHRVLDPDWSPAG